MNEELGLIFSEYIEKHAEECPIDFVPLLKAYPHLETALRKKIKIYQKIAVALATEGQVHQPHESKIIGKEISGCSLSTILGQGGMGVAYLAYQKKLAREVVVKVLRTFALNSSSLRERFMRESRIIGKLKHHNIVPIYDVGEENGELYIIMQYVAGVPLNRILEKLRGKDRSTLKMTDIEDALKSCLQPHLVEKVQLNGKNPTEFFSKITASIAKALQHAHDNGVIHRDIKPSNIIIEPTGNPVLVDFGLSHDDIEKNLTLSGEFLGTPIYTAPEVFDDNKTINLKSLDVYALGITLYECLTGALPYAGKSIYEIFHNIKTNEPTEPRKFWVKMPHDLGIIVMKAIFRKPELRYQSIREFSSDLESVLQGKPIKSGPITNWFKIRIWLKRSKKWVLIPIFIIANIALISLTLRQAEKISPYTDKMKAETLYQDGRSAIFKDDVNNAVANMVAAFQANPNWGKPLHDLADYFYRKKNYPLAIKYADMLLTNDTKDINSLIVMNMKSDMLALLGQNVESESLDKIILDKINIALGNGSDLQVSNMDLRVVKFEVLGRMDFRNSTHLASEYLELEKKRGGAIYQNGPFKITYPFLWFRDDSAKDLRFVRLGVTTARPEPFLLPRLIVCETNVIPGLGQDSSCEKVGKVKNINFQNGIYDERFGKNDEFKRLRNVIATQKKIYTIECTALAKQFDKISDDCSFAFNHVTFE